METQETNTQGTNTDGGQQEMTAHQKGGAKAAAVFWARFPTPEARSQLMKERFAKAKANRAKKAALAKPRPTKHTDRIKASEEQSEWAICELRILLGDVLDVLDACNAGGKPINSAGEQISRKCLMAAHSILMRGIRHLNVSGLGVGEK